MTIEIQYIGRRPVTEKDRELTDFAQHVETVGNGVRVTLSDGETIHEFPNWVSDGRDRGNPVTEGSYSYALSGTGELHVVERYHGPGTMTTELNDGKPSYSIQVTYGAHAWRSVTGPIGEVPAKP